MAERTYTKAVDNIFVTTWQTTKNQIVDNAFPVRPFLNRMVENGKIVQRENGGRTVNVPVEYAQQRSNVKWLARGEELGEAEDEFLTDLEYDWRYFGTGVSRFWQDDHQNRGKAKMHDYVQARLGNMRATLLTALEEAIFAADGSGIGIYSLGELVSSTPTTGTIAGIDRSTATGSWMANQALDFNGGGFTLATDMISRMTNMFNNCSNFSGGMRPTPDIIITTQTLHEEFEAAARAQHMIVANNSPRAHLGFGGLSFKNVELYYAPQCPANTMYFLNTEHLWLIQDPFAWMDMGDWKEKERSRDRVTQILSTMVLACSNFKKQGIIYNFND